MTIRHTRIADRPEDAFAFESVTEALAALTKAGAVRGIPQVETDGSVSITRGTAAATTTF